MDTSDRPTAVLGASAVGLAALLGAPDWRLALVAVLGGIATLTWPAAARAPIALLAAQAAIGPTPAIAAGVALLVLALARGPRAAALCSLALAALGASVVGLVVHRAPIAGAAFLLLAVAQAPIERLGSRSLRAGGLIAAALPGGWAVVRAYRSARASAIDFPVAIADAQRAGLHDLEGATRLGWAKSLDGTGQTEEARTILEAAPEPREPQEELMLADLEVRSGHDPQARFRLWRLAVGAPEARADLSERAAALWGRALLRRGNPHQALAVLQGVPGSEAAGLRALAASHPERGAPPCVNAFLGAAEDAHRCLETSPDNAVAKDLLARHVASAEGPSFSGAIRLLETLGPGRCVPAGSAATFEWTWQVEGGFAPGEDFYLFVHAYGPNTTLGADHRVGDRPTDHLVTGERWVDVRAIDVPVSAPPGRYHVNLGFYDPPTSLRLQPSNRPEHQSYAEGGAFEVCP